MTPVEVLLDIRFIKPITLLPVIQTDGPSDGLASADMHRAGNEVMGWTKVYGAENKKYN